MVRGRGADDSLGANPAAADAAGAGCGVAGTDVAGGGGVAALMETGDWRLETGDLGSPADGGTCANCRHHTTLFGRGFCERRALWKLPGETCHMHEGRPGAHRAGVGAAVLLLILLAGCAPLRPCGGLQGPQVPGVLVDDAGRCKSTRSVLFDRPAHDVWMAGCR